MWHRRLVKSFCVYGLSDESPLQLGTEGQEDGLNTIVSLRLLVFEGDEIVKCASELLEYVLLSKSSGKGVWLEVGYGRRGSHIRPGWQATDPAMSWVSFYYLPVEGDLLQIPADQTYEPVPVTHRQVRGHHKALGVVGGSQRYAGSYDLTGLLAAKQMPTHHLVMVYKMSSSDPPLTDLKLVATSPVTRVDGKVKRVVVLPEGYEQINYLLGTNHNAMLCYKRQKEAWNLNFQAGLVQMVPRDREAEHLAKASAMFCFPAGLKLTPEEQSMTSFSYILTSTPNSQHTPKEGRLYVTCVIFSEEISPSIRSALRISPSLRLFAQKCICLTSYYPFIDNYIELLKHALQLSMSKAEYPLERYIANVLDDIPIPDRGKTLVQFHLPTKTLSFSRPSVRAVQEISQSNLQVLFRCMKLESIVQVWSGLMLERKLIVHSTLKSILTPIILAFVGLLFPYKWDHVLIPVLPEQLNGFIDTIVPYIIGTSSPSALSSPPSDSIIVMLDTGSLISKSPLAPLPTKAEKKLMKRLGVYAGLYRSGVPMSDELIPSLVSDMKEEPVKVDAALVQDAFLELQCDLIRDYDLFFHIPSPGASMPQSSLSYINLPDYIRSRKLKPDHFLYQFLHTTLFTRFIEGRCFSSDSNTEHSYFDSALRFKRSGKHQRFISFDSPSKMYTCREVYTDDLPKETVVTYERFPILREDLWSPVRPLPDFEEHTAQAADSQLSSLTDGDWAKALLAAIYSLWLSVAAASVQKDLFRPRAQDMMTLALAVLQTAKKAKISVNLRVFDRLVEACGRWELKDTAKKLFKYAYYYGLYIQATAVSRTSVASPRSDCETSRGPNISDTLLLVSDACPSCGKHLSEEDIVEHLDRSVQTSNVTCFCSSVFHPKFSVVPLVPDCEGWEMELISPIVLASKLAYSSSETDVMQEISEEKQVYWNLAFYFSLIQLPSFILSQDKTGLNVAEIIENYIEKTSTFARFADSFNFRGKASPDLDVENEETEPVITRGSSEIVSQKLDFLLQRSSSTDSPSKQTAVKNVFGRYFMDFQRDNLAKRRRLREISREITEDVGSEFVDRSPPLMPIMHNKFT